MRTIADEYRPRSPEPTLLHTLVARHLVDLRAESFDPEQPDGGVPAFVVRELEAFLDCHDLARGFARLRCVSCRAEHLLAFACKTRTVCPSCSTRRMAQTAAFLVDHVLPDVPVRQWVLAPPFPLVPLLGARPDLLSTMNRLFVTTVFRWVESQVSSRGHGRARTGAVTFIQRFSRSLLLFPHLHVVVLDGAYVEEPSGALRFERTQAPTESDMAFVSRAVAHGMGRYLRRHGFIDNDALAAPTSPLLRWYAGLLAEPAGYADVDDAGGVGPRPFGARRRSTGEAQGFSVHAEVTVAAGDTDGRERLCRYAARPPLADAQRSMTRDGRVAVQLRGRRRGGAGHVVLEPVRFLRRLAWLIPPPGSPQVRFAGVLAGHAAWRSRVVPARSTAVANAGDDAACAAPARPRNAAAIAWHVLLRRTYDVDAQKCRRCGDRMRVVGVIHDPLVARRIVAHLERKASAQQARGPP